MPNEFDLFPNYKICDSSSLLGENYELFSNKMFQNIFNLN